MRCLEDTPSTAMVVTRPCGPVTRMGKLRHGGVDVEKPRTQVVSLHTRIRCLCSGVSPGSPLLTPSAT